VEERKCYGLLLSVVAIQMPQNASKPIIKWLVIGCQVNTLQDAAAIG
jgi:hypothetical protein